MRNRGVSFQPFGSPPISCARFLSGVAFFRLSHSKGEKGMSQGTLFNHRGAMEIERTELATIEAPEPTDTWFPLRHSTVLETVEETLGSSGFAIAKAQLSVSHEDKRFFGVLDIRSEIAEGVSLSVGVRNSCDKSFPIGFCAGTRTFVCDNLAFSSEVVIAKRHTRFGEDRFNEGIAKAVASPASVSCCGGSSHRDVTATITYGSRS